MRLATSTFAAGLALSLAAGAALSTPAAAAPSTYTIDPAHTSVAFLVGHLGFSKSIGLFRTVGGEIVFDQDAVEASKVKVVIDAASVFTNHEKRDAHLTSPDFLNAKEFKEMTFVSDRIEKTGEKTGRLHGTFTMLGVAKPLVLDVTFNKAGVSPASKKETVGFSARGTVKRSEHGMKYGVPNIGDDIELLIEVEATN